ncbi:MAG: tryptophan--tRNA ligase [Cyanobacteriota bacterium]
MGMAIDGPDAGKTRLPSSLVAIKPAPGRQVRIRRSDWNQMARARVLSGVQPTGALHLGNWLGAIRNWVSLQDSHDTFFCVVDLHAITVPHDPARLAADTRSTAALYLACGIDPAKATVFVQSQVAAHSELCWLLNCVTPLNWLERMIQFKEKALKQGDNVSVGLLDYPVLMAADILLYDADLVPVGEDQKQHLELARDIAQQRINSRFGTEEAPVLKVPEPMILKEGARVMSLTDGRSKMSKSDPNEGSRINLLDPPELITKKIKRAKTDPQMGLEFGNSERPETDNLLGLYALLSGQAREAVASECAEMGWGRFKPLLAEAAVAALQPVQERYAELASDPAELDRVLARGRQRASEVAEATLARTKAALGFLGAA